ncbi:MAG: hypothetical protein LQ351_008035 [Letrouitia transgressa]|nr:MAG: hypothetical protein LQ351_008035 [Letrouitia transgressa]
MLWRIVLLASLGVKAPLAIPALTAVPILQLTSTTSDLLPLETGLSTPGDQNAVGQVTCMPLLSPFKYDDCKPLISQIRTTITGYPFATVHHWVGLRGQNPIKQWAPPSRGWLPPANPCRVYLFGAYGSNPTRKRVDDRFSMEDVFSQAWKVADECARHGKSGEASVGHARGFFVSVGHKNFLPWRWHDLGTIGDGAMAEIEGGYLGSINMTGSETFTAI